MIASFALVLLSTACGTILTYLYDDGATLPTRFCTGACAGLAALGLIAFVIASFLGLTVLTITLTSGLLAVLCWIGLRDRKLRERMRRDASSTWIAFRQGLLHPTRLSLSVLFYIAAAVVLWCVFDRAVIVEEGGMYTGVPNNFGDLPFHLSVITSFVYGNNFPPEDPTFAGVKFTYPFLTDFISAVFVRCGAGLRESMFLENIVIAVSLVALIYRWAWELLRNKLAASLTPILVLLNGGFGFALIWSKGNQNDKGLIGALKELSSFTIIPETTWRWGNAISTLLIPQRGILLGLALSVIVFTQWWLSEETVETRSPSGKKKDKKQVQTPEPGPKKFYPFTPNVKRMIAAGVVAGLLPLVHAHSFVVVMAVGAGIALLRRRWVNWLAFFVVASVIALPQMLWSTHNSAVDATKFFEWHFGWDHGEESILWFWFKNTGLFIPLIVVAVLWRGKEYLISKRLLAFYLPFLICFIVPNVMKMAPWVWDNVKVLFYWWLASAPLVALLLARLWQQRGWQRVLSGVLLVVLTLAGALDVVSIALRSDKYRHYQVFETNGIAFAELIKRQTAPRSLIAHAPVHNAPVFLSGRRSLMGYPGHIWTHGLEFSKRESEIRRIYSGSPDAMRLLQELKIEYAVVGPLERNVMPVNEQFFSSFPKVGEVGAYRLYKTTTTTP